MISDSMLGCMYWNITFVIAKEWVFPSVLRFDSN